MAVVGSAEVLISGQLAPGFDAKLKAEIEAATLRAKATIPLTTNQQTLTNDLKAVESKVASSVAATSAKAKITPSVDTGKAEGAFAKLGSLIESKLQGIAGSSGIVSSSLKSVEGSATGAASGLTGVGIAGGVAVAGVAAVAAAAFKGIGTFQEATAQVRGFQRVTGETAETSSKFVGALNLLGIAPEGVSRAIGKLSKDIEGGSVQLSKFGIEAAKTKTGTTDLVGTLLNISDAFNSTDDQARKNAIALDIFGKQGLALVPILARGRQGIQELFAATKDSGLIFNQEDLTRGKELSLATKELKQSFQGLEISLAKDLVPALTAIDKGFTAVNRAASALHVSVPAIVGIGAAAVIASKAVSAMAASQAEAAITAAAAAKAEASLATSEIAAGTAATGSAAGHVALGGATVGAAAGIAKILPELVLLYAAYKGGTSIGKTIKDHVDLGTELDNLSHHLPIVGGFLAHYDESHRKAADAANKAKDATKGATVATEEEQVAAQAATESIKAQAAALDKLATAQETLIDKELGFAGAQRNVTKAQDAATKATDEIASSQDKAEKAQDALTTAVQKYGAQSDEAKQATDAYKLAQDAAKTAVENAKDAQDNLVTTAIAAAKAQRDETLALYDAQGVTHSAADAARLFKEDLQKQADQATGPTKAALDGLIAQLKDVVAPPPVEVHITTFKDTYERTYRSLQVDDGGGGNRGGGTAFRASGGPVAPGKDYYVGEAGLEKLTMYANGGGFVTPLAKPSAAPAPSGTFSSTPTATGPVSVTLAPVFPAATDKAEILAALREAVSDPRIIAALSTGQANRRTALHS